MKKLMVALVAACAAGVAFGYTVETDEVLKIDDDNVSQFADGIDFKDATGVVEFDTTAAPTMAITPDGAASLASCMKRPRASRTLSVESKSRTPAAQRAPHSPSESPAAQAKSTDFFFLSDT